MIDYTDLYREMSPSIADAIVAVQAEGTKLVKLWKEDPPVALKLYDRRGRSRTVACPYSVELAYLSCEARPDHDDFACVEYGPDYLHLTATESKRFLAAVRREKSIVDMVAGL